MKRTLAVILLAAVLLLTAACGKAENTNNANNTADASAPDFETYKAAANIKTGESVLYTTVCKTDASKTTAGKLTIKEVKHYRKGDELPGAVLEALDGYEWIEVKAETVFSDDNAKEFGADVMSCVTDYYNLKLFEAGLRTQGGYTSFAVRSKGSEVVFDQCLFVKVVDNPGWSAEGESVCSYTWYFRVPEKYDGIVIVFMSAGTQWPDGKNIYEILGDDAWVCRVTD